MNKVSLWQNHNRNINNKMTSHFMVWTIFTTCTCTLECYNFVITITDAQTWLGTHDLAIVTCYALWGILTIIGYLILFLHTPNKEVQQSQIWPVFLTLFQNMFVFLHYCFLMTTPFVTTKGDKSCSIVVTFASFFFI